MNEICPNCGKPTSEHLMIFYPDGRVEETCRKYVSVPVEFIEAVQDAITFGWLGGWRGKKIKSMLTEIEKGGGG